MGSPFQKSDFAHAFACLPKISGDAPSDFLRFRTTFGPQTQETLLLNSVLGWLTFSARAVLNRLGDVGRFDVGAIRQIRDPVTDRLDVVVRASLRMRW